MLPNADNAPLCATDFNLQKQESALPIMLVCDGKIMQDNLKIAQVDEVFVKKCLLKAEVFKIKDCMLATLDNFGKMYVQPKNKQYKSFNVNYKGGGNW